MNPEDLSGILPPSIVELELSQQRERKIPEQVTSIYSSFRPTPLFRAEKFEEALGTNCEIYIKDEGKTPTGNHKPNSAYLLACLCKKDGIDTITTETTGNWGIALALASREFDLETICFIDSESHRKRPDRKKAMENEGAKVIVVEQDNKCSDLLALSADAAIEYTKKLKNAAYIFGSVYGYFVIPQSIISLEAKEQLEGIGKYPDIVVGSCGGGANLLGASAVFIDDKLNHRKQIEIFSTESELCPILTKGKRGLYSIDTKGFFPSIETYGLDGVVKGDYIGGLGSTIVASAAANLYESRIIEAKRYTSQQARKAAELFHKTEGTWVALETSYLLAGVIDKAGKNRNDSKVILATISSGINDTQFYRGLK